MPSLYLITLLLLALIVLIALPPVRSTLTSQLRRLRQGVFPPPPGPARTGTTVIAGNGDEIQLGDDRTPMSMAARLELAGGRRGLLILVLIGLLVLIGAWQLYRYTNAPTPEQFVVLVAPFREPGGTPGQTGRAVAAELAAALPQASGGRVVAQALDTPPASLPAALDLLASSGADALVWGDIAGGGMLDRTTLRPTLVYRPNGPFAPLGWAGYAGRFAMPAEYVLAGEPVNGAVVLPALLGALADYDAGRFDAAAESFGTLLGNYPALAPTLPRALRGNMLWARGEYQQAINEYQQATRSTDGPAAALLYNNLGAIQEDAGDNLAATSSFNSAITALRGGDLAALRYNLGIQWLRAGRTAEAVGALEIARNPALLAGTAAPAPVLLALAQAYRQNGQFEQAQALIDAAERQAASDAGLVTAELRNITRARLRAETEAEHVLLDLAQKAGARGPLMWELLGSDALSMRDLDSARSQISQAVDDSRVLAQLWARLATAKDAAGEQFAGQIAISQSLQAQAQLRERLRWQALIEIERGSVQGATRPQGLAAIWVALTGDRSPLGRGRAILEDLLNSQPADVDALILLGHSQLINGNLDAARPHFEQAAQLAPGRPEPVYGQALAALPSDRSRAKQLLADAIAKAPGFFPARQRLVALAEEDRDWPTVVEQRRWLAANRPSHANTLALAVALRQSGPDQFAAAEQLLLPLANQGDTSAMIALSELYQQHGDGDAARQMLARAQQAAPRDSTVAYQYGRLLEQQRDADGALAAYTHAIELNTADIPARLALGRLYTAKGQPLEAGQQYEVALRAGAQDPAELGLIGAVLLENGEYDAAATAYERAIGAQPNNGDPADANTALAALYHGLGQADLKRGQIDAAATAEQRALELRGNAYPEALVGLGDIALLRNQAAGAVDQYNAAIKLDPRLAAAYIGLGRASGALGNWVAAQAHFRDAVAIDARSAEAHLWLGEALVRQPEPPLQAAIDEYVRALELRENRYPEAYFGLAQAQMASGRGDLARENLALALQLRPGYADALLLQGKLFEQLGDPAAARDSYTRAIAASKALAEPYYRRALLSLRADQLDDAAGDLEDAIGIQANFSEAHYWLGRIYLAQNRPKPAREQFILAIEQRNNHFADARFYQGLAEEQLGQRDDAVQSYQAALEQGGTSEWAGEARTALSRLRQP